MAKRYDGPKPGSRVEREKDCVNGDNFAAQVGGSVVEQAPQNAPLCTAGDLRGVRQFGIGDLTNVPILPF
jgi:hypothetical protein